MARDANKAANKTRRFPDRMCPGMLGAAGVL
jgi:hypothetical protein